MSAKIEIQTDFGGYKCYIVPYQKLPEGFLWTF